MRKTSGMQCDPGSWITFFGLAFGAGFRYAVARRAGRIVSKGGDVLDREEEPERFGFWQGVWLTLAIVFGIAAALNFACYL